MQIGLNHSTVINSFQCPLDSEDHIHILQHGRASWSTRPAAASQGQPCDYPWGSHRTQATSCLCETLDLSSIIHLDILSFFTAAAFFTLCFNSVHLSPHFSKLPDTSPVTGCFVFDIPLINQKEGQIQSETTELKKGARSQSPSPHTQYHINLGGNLSSIEFSVNINAFPTEKSYATNCTVAKEYDLKS